MAARFPLVAIVGPTASGKTALAVEVANRYDGEIICADSRTIYRHMDIGTAKPTQAEQSGVVHWGLNLVEPGERFTVADFKTYADAKIEEIYGRGHLPVMVGGTGLYVDAVLSDFYFGRDVVPGERALLEAKSIEELWQYCTENNILLPENTKNRRYVIRQIERNGESNRDKANSVNSSIIVGIATEKTILRDRIHTRAEQLFDDGVVDEAKMLGEKYGWDSEAMTGNIYPLVHKLLNGQIVERELIEKFEIADRQLAKRQLTWFRRNPEIMWAIRSGAGSYIDSVLNEHIS